VVFTLDGTCLLRHVLPVSILQQFDQAALELLERAQAYYGENLVTFAIYGSVGLYSRLSMNLAAAYLKKAIMRRH